MRGLGTLINVASVLLGGGLGVAIGHRLAERVRETIMQSLALVVLAIAITGLGPLGDPEEGLRRFIIVIAGLILGAVIGEGLRLEDRLENAGERLRRRFHVPAEDSPSTASSPFVEGFVVATTLFCVGPLAVLGALEDGLGISMRILAIKSAVDGVAAAGLASALGWGVVASVVPILVYQGAITLAATALADVVTDEVVALLGAVGSLLVMAIGLRLLDLMRIRVLNLLPALLLVPVIGSVVEVLA